MGAYFTMRAPFFWIFLMSMSIFLPGLRRLTSPPLGKVPVRFPETLDETLLLTLLLTFYVDVDVGTLTERFELFFDASGTNGIRWK